MRWIIIAAILEETFREHLQAIFNTADRQCRWPYGLVEFGWVTLYTISLVQTPTSSHRASSAPPV
jgi:hypothetical protein